MFTVAHDTKRGWCVLFDGMHICTAINEAVANQTAQAMQASRRNHYSRDGY